MPPLYTYHDKKTEKQFDVLRAFADYEQIPTLEEAVAEGMTPEQYQDADWERIIWGTQAVVKGSNWGGGKGSWIQLLTLAGLTCAQALSYFSYSLIN